jgi:hypothetical protein
MKHPEITKELALANDVDVYDEDDLLRQYDEMLDECAEAVKIGCVEFDASRVLKEMDETAYNCGFSDYTSEDWQAIQDESGNWFYISKDDYETLEDVVLTYHYHVDLDERGYYNAHIEDCNGVTVYSIPDIETMQELIEDGFMSDSEDMDGLMGHLISINGIPKDSELEFEG